MQADPQGTGSVRGHLGIRGSEGTDSNEILNGRLCRNEEEIPRSVLAPKNPKGGLSSTVPPALTVLGHDHPAISHAKIPAENPAGKGQHRPSRGTKTKENTDLVEKRANPAG